MKDIGLFEKLVLQVTGMPLMSQRPVYLSGLQVVEALWPLNEVFRPKLAMVRGLPYDPLFEREADEAIASRALGLPGADWDSLPAGAWRVLLERLQQAIVVAAANEAAGNLLMPIPDGFPENARTAAAMLFLLHQMKLPFPIADRSDMTLPAGSAQASLQRH